MKEIKVEICISGEEISEDQVTDALIDICESKGWEMGGGVTELQPNEPPSPAVGGMRWRKVNSEKDLPQFEAFDKVYVCKYTNLPKERYCWTLDMLQSKFEAEYEIEWLEETTSPAVKDDWKERFLNECTDAIDDDLMFTSENKPIVIKNAFETINWIETNLIKP